MIMKRILGLLMLLTGLTILAVALIGAYFAGDVLGYVADGLTNSLTLATQSLDAAADTLELSRSSMNDVSAGLEAAVGATTNTSRTLNDSRPLIDNVAAVTTQEVPEAVEGIQAALPNLIEVASILDRTLVTLSTVGIDRDIPLPFGGSIPLRFDLGIDYDPDVPFDASLRVFESSLEGLPESLRGLEDDLQSTNMNLATLSNDLLTISDNIATINTQIDEITPLLDQYADLVTQLNLTVAQVEGRIESSLNMARIGIIALLIAVGLTQLAPIYLGWELLTGRREQQIYTYTEAPQPEINAPIIRPMNENSIIAPIIPADGETHQATSADEEHHAPS